MKNFYDNLFDAVIDLLDNRQISDGWTTTEDIFIDDDLFTNKDIKDDSKQIIDNILKILIILTFWYSRQHLKRTLKSSKKH